MEQLVMDGSVRQGLQLLPTPHIHNVFLFPQSSLYVVWWGRGHLYLCHAIILQLLISMALSDWFNSGPAVNSVGSSGTLFNSSEGF